MLRKLLALLSDSVVYGISGSLNRLVGLLLLPFLTDHLSKAEFGVVFMLAIVGALFVPLASLGMTNAIFRRFNQNKDPGTRARVLVTGLTSVACSTLFALVVAQLLATQISWVIVGDESTTSLVRLTLLGSAASSVSSVFFVALRAARRVKTAATMNVLKATVSASASLALVIGADLGVLGMVLGGLLADIVTALAQIAITLKEFRGALDRQLWKDMLSYGLPFTPHQLQSVALELFGIYMVRQMLGLETAAIYGIAARFAAPVSLVVNSVQTSWVPYKFKIHAEDENPSAFFQSAFVYYVAGLSYLWMGVAVWGPELVRLMTAPNFHDAAWIVWATSLVPVAHGLYFMSSTGFELGNNTRSLPIVSLSGLVTVVIGAFVLIEPLGALGAALATSLGWLMMAAIIYVLSQRRFPIAYDWPTLGTLVAVAALFVLVGYGLQTAPIAARLPVLFLLSLLYPVFGFVLLLHRSRDEKARMRVLLSKLRLVSSNR